PFEGIMGEKRIVVLTKSDAVAFRRDAVEAEIVVSARTREGLDALRESIAARLGLREGSEGLLVLDRHREVLERCRDALRESEEALSRGDEWAAAALRRALFALGEITGETATEELLDRIFARFCVGK